MSQVWRHGPDRRPLSLTPTWRRLGRLQATFIGKSVLGWWEGEWLENRCSRKVFHTGVPTLAIDFSLSGLASLPVVFVLPEEYVLKWRTDLCHTSDLRRAVYLR